MEIIKPNWKAKFKIEEKAYGKTSPLRMPLNHMRIIMKDIKQQNFNDIYPNYSQYVTITKRMKNI